MDSDLAQKSVSLALQGRWEEAISVNKEILQSFPQDVETLNRLARAYFEFGDLKKAKLTSARVLKEDPFNPIATRCLAKWKGVRAGKKGDCRPTAQTASFIEEPGKTKIVTLLNLGDKETLGKLTNGAAVKISHHAHRVSIVSSDGKYIGRLPDDLAARLRLLLEAGNTYEAFLKCLDPNRVKVFLRETYCTPKMAKMRSFPIEALKNSETAGKEAT